MTPLNNIVESSETIEAYLAPPDIHEARREYAGASMVLTLLMSVIMTVVQCLNIYLLLWQNMSPVLAIIIHLVSLVVTGFIAFIQRRAGGDVRYTMMLLVTTAFMGPFGAVGSLLMVLLGLFYGPLSHNFRYWYESIFPKDETTLPEQIYASLIQGRDENPKEYSVVSFMDVMVIGSEEQKRHALSKMTSNFYPSFAPAFRKALVDKSNTIRVQAATAISKIENSFHERLLAIESLNDEYPNNAVIKKALADHYDGYAFTGILDADREMENRSKAYTTYLEYLALKPDDTNVRLKVGRLLLRMDKAMEAADWFRTCIKEGYHSPSIRAWLMECLYKNHQFAELRHVVSGFTPYLDNFRSSRPEFVEALELWNNEAHPENEEEVA